MAVRTTMADLITRVRNLVGDPVIAGTPPTSVFEDQDYQDELDFRRMDVIETQLAFRPTTTGGGPAVQYRDYWAPYPNWENSVVLKDATNAVLTPTTSDLLRAHWTFAAGQLPPVFISGAFFDIYGSAAAILDRWVGKVALEFDFQADRQQYTRTDKRKGLEALALTYRRRAIQPGRRPEWRSAEWRAPLWE